MKVEELRERLQKAEENVEKRKATIERQKKQLEKKIAEAVKLGCNPDTETSSTYADGVHHDQYWAMCDVSNKKTEIKDSYKKLAELEKIVNNWKEKLDKAEFNDDFWKREIPEALKSYRTYLVEEWNKYDKEKRERLQAKYSELGYTDFIKKYKYTGYEFMSYSDEQINKDNETVATNLILDLYSRVFKYTGKITSWDYLTISQGHINGWVKGEKSNARVESILAGGYNIQKLHVRVLVHEYKDALPKISKDYKGMSISELEELADSLNVKCKKYDNQAIYRMRLTMAIKNATNN